MSRRPTVTASCRAAVKLIVVHHQSNKLVVLLISPDLATASQQTTQTDSDLDVPTTVAGFGSSLYVVDAKRGATPPTPTTPYEIVKVQARYSPPAAAVS